MKIKQTTLNVDDDCMERNESVKKCETLNKLLVDAKVKGEKEKC